VSKRPDIEPTFEFAKNSSARPFNVRDVLSRFQKKKEMVDQYSEAYGRYCWEVSSINDFKIAPFHILATEGHTYFDKDHVWHMDQIHRFCKMDPDIIAPTHYKNVDVTDARSQAEAEKWWLELTETGGEGMVVKPLGFISRGKRGLVQPAVKVRGKEYLRIIYGPEYTDPNHLERLRSRGLGVKRSLALREFALGVEALERFVRKEPLRRVHECVFGVLALESEPVDPRL
jgi:protein phosphatase